FRHLLLHCSFLLSTLSCFCRFTLTFCRGFFCGFLLGFAFLLSSFSCLFRFLALLLFRYPGLLSLLSFSIFLLLTFFRFSRRSFRFLRFGISLAFFLSHPLQTLLFRRAVLLSLSCTALQIANSLFFCRFSCITFTLHLLYTFIEQFLVHCHSFNRCLAFRLQTHGYHLRLTGKISTKHQQHQNNKM